MIYFNKGYLYNTIWKASEELPKGGIFKSQKGLLKFKNI